MTNKRVYTQEQKDRAKIYAKAYREANKEKIAADSKVYRAANREKLSNNGKIYRDKNQERLSFYIKEYAEKNKEHLNEYRKYMSKEWRDNNKKSVAAHYILNKAIKANEIERQPCWICGENKVDAHHFDYDTPLAVTWLCRIHHKHVHAGR